MPEETWTLTGVFGLLGLYKLVELVVNRTAAPARVRQYLVKADYDAKVTELIEKWYCNRQPRINLLYLVSLPLLVTAPFVPVPSQYAFIGGYVMIDAVVEFRLFRGRQEIWETLEPVIPGLPSRSG
jgi:hypothetical protein